MIYTPKRQQQRSSVAHVHKAGGQKPDIKCTCIWPYCMCCYMYLYMCTLCRSRIFTLFWCMPNSIVRSAAASQHHPPLPANNHTEQRMRSRRLLPPRMIALLHRVGENPKQIPRQVQYSICAYIQTDMHRRSGNFRSGKIFFNHFQRCKLNRWNIFFDV